MNVAGLVLYLQIIKGPVLVLSVFVTIDRKKPESSGQRRFWFTSLAKSLMIRS